MESITEEDGKKMSYTYNSDFAETRTMTLEGKKLRTDYDSLGNAVSILYNGTEYDYMRNLQGDVIGLMNKNGEWVVRYRYDVWGNILEVSGIRASTLGQDNPIRYRGYYYDAETGLYYVSSRYYDPQLCRFISADSQLDIVNGLSCFNLYAYCGNNPENRIDENGQSWEDVKNWFKKKAESAKSYVKKVVDSFVHKTVSKALSGAANLIKEIHYGRNLFNNTSYSLEELGSPLLEEESKFHQNNTKNNQPNNKYVKGTWFSSEVVYYSDGTINDTPEDRGTLNVYYGPNPIGKYLIHCTFDVIPYMIWGNSPDDSTTIVDRIKLCF